MNLSSVQRKYRIRYRIRLMQLKYASFLDEIRRNLNTQVHFDKRVQVQKYSTIRNAVIYGAYYMRSLIARNTHQIQHSLVIIVTDLLLYVIKLLVHKSTTFMQNLEWKSRAFERYLVIMRLCLQISDGV